MTKHKKAEWYGKWYELPNGSYIDKNGSVCYVENGRRHRDDGPAVEWSTDYEWWWYLSSRNCASEWYINGAEYYTEEAYWEAIKVWKMNEAMK